MRHFAQIKSDYDPLRTFQAQHPQFDSSRIVGAHIRTGMVSYGLGYFAVFLNSLTADEKLEVVLDGRSGKTFFANLLDFNVLRWIVQLFMPDYIVLTSCRVLIVTRNAFTYDITAIPYSAVQLVTCQQAMNGESTLRINTGSKTTKFVSTHGNELQELVEVITARS